MPATIWAWTKEGQEELAMSDTIEHLKAEAGRNQRLAQTAGTAKRRRTHAQRAKHLQRAAAELADYKNACGTPELVYARNKELLVEIGQKQSRIERLEAALNSAAGALTYYTEVEYDVSSDVQSGYGIEVLDEIEDVLSETTKNTTEMTAVEIGEYMLRHGRLPGEDDETEQRSDEVHLGQGLSMSREQYDRIKHLLEQESGDG